MNLSQKSPPCKVVAVCFVLTRLAAKLLFEVVLVALSLPFLLKLASLAFAVCPHRAL